MALLFGPAFKRWFLALPTSEPVAAGVFWNNNGVVTYSDGIAPTITDQPDDASANQGSTATFTVVATNATSYQWQKQESGAGAWSNISGATSSSYTTGVLGVDDNTDKFRCVVTGSGGSTTSNSATLTVVLTSFTLTTSGLLFAPSETSLTDWTSTDAAWSVATKPTFLASGKIDRFLGDVAYPKGRRNPTLLKDGSTLYLFSNDYPNGSDATPTFVDKSSDMGRSWTTLGETGDARAKIGGGTWLGAVPGWFEKRGSTYYFHRVLTDTPGGFPPYEWDIWSATNLETLVSGKYGNWSSVRTQAGGTGWASADLLPGSTVLHSGTYYHFAQASGGSPSGFKIGILSGSAPQGPFTQLSSTAILTSADFAGARQPENPRVFLHPGLNKYCMLVNLIDPTGSFTDSNGIVVGTSDPTDWTGASVEIVQFVSDLHGSNNIGTWGHVAAAENVLVYNSSTNDFAACYDAEATGVSPGWHTGRKVFASVMRHSAGEYAVTTAASDKRLTKSLSHTSVVAECWIKFTSSSGGSIGIGVRGTTGQYYLAGFRDNGTSVLYDTDGSVLLATGVGNSPFPGWNHCKVVASGNSVKVYLNGELQIDFIDGSNRYPNGTSVCIYQASATGYVRGFRVYTGQSIAMSGLNDRQVITLRGSSGICLDEAVAGSDGVATVAVNADAISFESGSNSVSLAAPIGSAITASNVGGLPSVSAVSASFSAGTSTLSCTASNATSYRWQRKDGDVWRNVGLNSASGAVSSILSVWRCIVSNANGSIASQEVEPSIPGEVIHLDASVGVFTERTGASAATATSNGGLIGTWRDSIASRNFVASSDGVRPTLSSGRLLVVNDYLDYATSNELRAKSAFTVVAKFARTGATLNQLLLQRTGVVGIQWFGDEIYVYAGTGQAKFADTSTDERVIVVVFDGTQTGNANRLKAWIDGVQKTLTFVANAPATTENNSGLAIGDAYGAPATAPWDGSLTWLRIFDQALTADEVAFLSSL